MLFHGKHISDFFNNDDSFKSVKLKLIQHHKKTDICCESMSKQKLWVNANLKCQNQQQSTRNNEHPY